MIFQEFKAKGNQRKVKRREKRKKNKEAKQTVVRWGVLNTARSNIFKQEQVCRSIPSIREKNEIFHICVI